MNIEEILQAAKEADLSKYLRSYSEFDEIAEQAADAAQCKLAGAYSAINRLRIDNRIRVAGTIPRPGITGRNTLLWTWNEEEEKQK